jgi:SpoU rRNA methylase family enzyme
MLVQAIVPALVCVVGVLIYALSANPKVSEMGRIAYSVGLFWAVYDIAKDVVHLP